MAFEYVEGDSVFHKMDPRAKVFLSICMIAMAMIFKGSISGADLSIKKSIAMPDMNAINIIVTPMTFTIFFPFLRSRFQRSLPSPACHAAAQRSVGGTPETLRFLA